MIISGRIFSDNGDGENKSCVIIEVDRKEVSRVAFVRRFGANPYTEFEQQLDQEVSKARTAVARIEELFAAAGQLQ